jgi:hypothetical protein
LFVGKTRLDRLGSGDCPVIVDTRRRSSGALA